MRYRLLEGRLVPILKRGDERDLALAESRARRQLEQIAAAYRRDHAATFAYPTAVPDPSLALALV